MLTFAPFQTSTIWQLPDPDTGRMHTGRTRAELVSAVVNYRLQNKLAPIIRLDLVIDNYLCSLPQNSGKCKQTVLKRGFLQYLKGGIALIEQLYYGDKNIVSQEKADERASICKNCPCNSYPDRDMFIKWADAMTLHMVGERKSSLHEELGSCEACTCNMRAKVFFKGPFDLSVEEREKMKDCNPSCWQLKEK